MLRRKIEKKLLKYETKKILYLKKILVNHYII